LITPLSGLAFHDLAMLAEVFRCPDGSYADANAYRKSYYLVDLIEQDRTTNMRSGERKSQSCDQLMATSPITTNASSGRVTFHSDN